MVCGTIPAAPGFQTYGLQEARPVKHGMGMAQARWVMSENEERKVAGHFTGARWKTGDTWRGMPVPEMIGRRLKSCYGELQHQPLPQQLKDLLKELDAKEDKPTVARRR